jgi:hypothetical protein
MVIQPTVGRKVWFYQSVAAASDPATQPQDATIVYVITDRLVNLRVSDQKGDQTPALAVQLYQEGDEDPSGSFACWMPYQSQQAKKDREGLEKRVAELESQVQSLLHKPSESASKATPVQPLAGDMPVQPAGELKASHPAPAPLATKQVTK